MTMTAFNTNIWNERSYEHFLTCNSGSLFTDRLFFRFDLPWVLMDYGIHFFYNILPIAEKKSSDTNNRNL